MKIRIAILTFYVVWTGMIMAGAIKVAELRQPQCGDFQYYDDELKQCLTFRNYEQEARYKGLID